MTLHTIEAADFAGLLAWRSCLRATFPRRRPNASQRNRIAWRLRLSNVSLQWPACYFSSAIAKRSTSALQSRGGDGFSCECNRMAVARLPEHEVCGDCEGRGARYWLFRFRGVAAGGVKLRKKNS
jgi:hypothetical protein